MSRINLSMSLLKIQFGAIRAGDQRAASPILRGSTLIAMMRAADFGKAITYCLCRVAVQDEVVECPC